MRLFSNKRKSGVSQAIINVLKTTNESPKTLRGENLIVEIAHSERQKQKSYRLAYDSYLEKGYVSEQEDGMLTNELDLNPDTTVINVYDDQKEIVGTATLNFNTYAALPCEELFQEEVFSYNLGEASFEITRLAIKKNLRNSKEILSYLFQAAFIYAYKLLHVENVFIEVNPRHVSFYSRMLGFEIIGNSEAACARVNGAPAKLLHAKMSEIDSQITKFYNKEELNSFAGFVKNAMPYEKMLILKKKFERYVEFKLMTLQPVDDSY